MTSEPAHALERIFRSVLRVDPATPIDSISVATHGGWDSSAHINLILAVEQEFRIMLTPEEATRAQSFGAMLELVNRKR